MSASVSMHSGELPAPTGVLYVSHTKHWYRQRQELEELHYALDEVLKKESYIKLLIICMFQCFMQLLTHTLYIVHMYHILLVTCRPISQLRTSG